MTVIAGFATKWSKVMVCVKLAAENEYNSSDMRPKTWSAFKPLRLQQL